MSLLERAQQMKKSTNKEKKSKTETKNIDQKENLETIKKKKEEKDTITTSELEEANTVEKITAKHEPKGLLERVQEKRTTISKKGIYWIRHKR